MKNVFYLCVKSAFFACLILLVFSCSKKESSAPANAPASGTSALNDDGAFIYAEGSAAMSNESLSFTMAQTRAREVLAQKIKEKAAGILGVDAGVFNGSEVLIANSRVVKQEMGEDGSISVLLKLPVDDFQVAVDSLVSNYKTPAAGAEFKPSVKESTAKIEKPKPNPQAKKDEKPPEKPAAAKLSESKKSEFARDMNDAAGDAASRGTKPDKTLSDSKAKAQNALDALDEW